MRIRRVTVSKGTPAELAEHATGYSANGESQHSRLAAHGGKVTSRRDPNAEVRRDRINYSMPIDEKIRRVQIDIGKLEGRLIFARRVEPEAVGRLEKNLKIKNAMLRELGRQRNDPNYVPQKISV